MHSNTLTSLLLLLLCCACGSGKNENNLTQLQEWDYTAESELTRTALDSFISDMRQRGYKFSSYAECAGKEDSAAEFAQQYGHGFPYAIPNFIQTSDSLEIRIQIADFGCHLYTGNYRFTTDTLILEYENISYSSCYPKCLYQLIYTIKNPDVTPLWISYSPDEEPIRIPE